MVAEGQDEVMPRLAYVILGCYIDCLGERVDFIHVYSYPHVLPEDQQSVGSG